MHTLITIIIILLQGLGLSVVSGLHRAANAAQGWDKSCLMDDAECMPMIILKSFLKMKSAMLDYIYLNFGNTFEAF